MPNGTSTQRGAIELMAYATATGLFFFFGSFFGVFSARISLTLC